MKRLKNQCDNCEIDLEKGHIYPVGPDVDQAENQIVVKGWNLVRAFHVYLFNTVLDCLLAE